MVVKIPVSPPVRSYLLSFYQNKPIHYKITDPLSLVLFSPFRRINFGEKPLIVKGDCFVEAKLPSELVEKGRTHITADDVKRLEYYITGKIYEELFYYVQKLTMTGMKQKAAIESFCDHWSIDYSETTYENLKKAYYREKTRRERIEN